MKIKLAAIVFMIAVMGALLFIAGSAQQTDDPGVLFRAAVEKEEVDGDLQGAIELYKKIIAEHSNNRGIAAKAQLHIGLCFEKLGLKEAPKAYQKVVDDYPEQKEAVKIAKEKLTRIVKAKAMIEEGDKEFTLRKVWSGPEADGLGRISPDGRYLAYTDWNTGNLAVLELGTGKKRRLTNKSSWIESKEFALNLAWSPDSKQIAYNWWDEPNYKDMRVIGLNDSKPRTIHNVQDPDKELAIVYDWSQDAKYILGLKWTGHGREASIVLISVADGSENILKALDLKRVRYNKMINMAFSPDGNYIVYDRPTEEKNHNRDIILFSIKEKNETPLVEHPAHDILLGWGPDGRHIFFKSDRRGTMDAWIIPVEEGKAKGTPELLRKDMGEILPQGFTSNGSFYYITSKLTENVYVAILDPETGKILSRPKSPIKHIGESTRSPSYSPDGKSLAYVAVRGPEGNTRSVLCIRSLETGRDRELYPEILGFWQLRWSPDSRSILTITSDKKDRSGHSLICKIDTETGDVSTVGRCEDIRLKQWVNSVEWSIDGKAIFYVRCDKSNDLCQLLVKDLESGQEKELYRASNWAERFTMSRSPDGKWLVLVNYKAIEQRKRTLRIIAAEGGEPHELFSSEAETNSHLHPGWTADGRYILFPRPQAGAIADTSNRVGLWRIPIEGGNPQKMGLTMYRIWYMSAHPDGQRLAFDSYGPTQPMPELWVMENFSPKEKDK